MRIAFLSNVFPNPLTPGRGTFNAALVHALAAEHTLHVISPIPWVERLAARLRGRPGCETEIVQIGPRTTARFPTFYYSPKLMRPFYGRFLDWSIGRTLDADLDEFQPDALVSYWAHPDGEVALRAARRRGIPAVTMVGGSDVLLLGRHRARRRAIWNVLRQSDSVVAVSEDLAECVCRGGISAEKVHVVRRGVNRELFQPGDRSAARQRLGIATDRPTLIAVGRLVPVKGFSVLIEACRQLHEQRIPIACYILGSGPLEKALHEQIRRHRLEDVVYLAGGQTQAALANWYRAADLTVLSSLSEGIPNVLLESIASGTPFVATRVGGLPEIADPRAHRLVPPNHPAALAEAIADRLQQGPYSAPLRFEPLSWSESAEELCQVIANCRRDGDAGPRIHGDTPVSAELLTTPQAQR